MFMQFTVLPLHCWNIIPRVALELYSTCTALFLHENVNICSKI